MADVFLSYRRTDRERVTLLAERLRAAGLDVWFDARLEVGRGEGFDAEIEREVTSAACVVVCWSHEALRSVYVKAEAKKGLGREVLVPVFLEPCDPPVPFNGVDTVDLVGWDGADDGRWQRLLTAVRRQVDASRADMAARRAHATAAYDRITEEVYPGTLAALTPRIVALHERDAAHYHDDIEALLGWIGAVAAKEARYTETGWEQAYRQDGGSAWQFWDRGDAAERADRIARVRALLAQADAAWGAAEATLRLPAP